MSKEVEVKISFMMNTDNPDKIEWMREIIFGILFNEDEVKRVDLNVKR